MFNLQRFGDNDTVTADDSLTLSFARSDNSQQNIKLPQPLSNGDASSIRSAMQSMLDNQILLDSKTGEIMTTDTAEINTAYMTERTIRELDLS